MSTTVGATTTSSPNGGIDGPSTGRLPPLPGPTTSVVLPNPSTSAGQRQFVTQVFNDVQATWKTAFTQVGLRYTPARLVLFSSVVPTACGTQTSDVGPLLLPG